MKRNNLLFITTLCSISLLHSATHLDLTNFKKALQQNNTSEMVRLYRMLKADTSANGQSRAQTAKAEAQYRGVDIEALVTASSAPRRRRPAAPATTATTSPSTTATMPATTTTPAATSTTPAVTPPMPTTTTPTMSATPTTPSSTPSKPALPISGPKRVVYNRPADAGITPPTPPANPATLPTTTPADQGAQFVFDVLPDAPGGPSGTYAPSQARTIGNVSNRPLRPVSRDINASLAEKMQDINESFADIDGKLNTGGWTTSTEASRVEEINKLIQMLQNDIDNVPSVNLNATERAKYQNRLNGLLARLAKRIEDGKATRVTTPQAPAMQSTGSSLNVEDIQDRIARANKYFNGGLSSYTISFGAVQKNYQEAQNAFNEIRGNIRDGAMVKDLDEQLENLKAKIDAKKSGSSTTPPPVLAKPSRAKLTTFQAAKDAIEAYGMEGVEIPADVIADAKEVLATLTAGTPQYNELKGMIGS